MNSNTNKAIIDIFVEIKKTLSEQSIPGTESASLGVPAPKKKTKKVIFDKSTDAPFEAIFSERGFSINGTRLSFEDIETALSKEFNITLQNGKGLELDAVKMQKILKYKEL